ncbi:diaminobutyrate acetyltransferase [Rhodobacteraceae bacterium WD3A24]|nr:diaminobutyrate acetyltransferase [Rhodobacteraceae bacterium WD3A24]
MNTASDEAGERLTLRAPTSEDGADVWQLIRDSGPLDENSIYCNTLQCDQFGDTCVIAELDGEIVGWVSAFIEPGDPETLFIWQVAVSQKARGMGVARRMLEHLLARDVCAGVTRLQTTITADNEASWALFNSFADRIDATLEHEPHYKREDHFEGRHATEYMVTIGEFDTAEIDDSSSPAQEKEEENESAAT